MALTLRHILLSSVLALTSTVEAAVKTYDFNIGWVTASPDGFERPTIGINGQWPIPRIDADVGDRIVVNVRNDLGNQSTSLHWHGIYMNGSTHMDGATGVSQCGIAPGANFVYNFTVDQPGTYWYHSHTNGQYPDGLRGPLIIHDPDSPYEGKYDDELVLTLSDWYHDQMPGLIKWFISVANPTGAEPVPDSALMNDTQNLQINVEPGKTYLIHLINMGAFAGQYFWIEGHEFDIVEVDGIWTQPSRANQIYLTAAQRYSILLTTKNSTTSNFAIIGSMDTDLFDTIPDTLNPNVTSYLVYDTSLPMPTPALLADSFNPFDDIELVPYDNVPLYTDPSQQITLDVVMDNLNDGANYAFFNNITYVSPKVPTLYSVLSSGPSLATNPTIYGSHTNAFVLSHNEVVEIVVNNHDPGKHPFHLHGHAFQAIARGDDDSGDYDPSNVTLPDVPMRRDTFMVRPNGHVVLRFRSDNPGVWLFHCHIEWHVDSGLIATIVEAPLALQSQYPSQSSIPESHLQTCSLSSTPTFGNAASHGADLSSASIFSSNTSTITTQSKQIQTDPTSQQISAWLDLKGEPHPPPHLPSGFTAKGYVAMVFSVLSAVIGIAALVWYGTLEIGTGKIKQ